MVSWGTQTLGKRPGAKHPTFGLKPQRFIFEMIPVIEKVRLPIMAPLLRLQFRPVSISEDLTC